MSDTAATFYGASPFAGRGLPFDAVRRLFRALCSSVVIGLSAVAAVGLLIAAVTVTAAWILNTSLAGNPHIHAKALSGPGTLALAGGDPAMARADMTFESKWARASTGAVPLMPEITNNRAIARARGSMQVAALTPAARPAVTPLPPRRMPERANNVPLPPSRPVQALQEIAKAPVEQPAPQTAPIVVAKAEPKAAPQVVSKVAPKEQPKAAPQFAMLTPPPAAAEKRVAPQAQNKAMTLPDPDSRTAVYDISARTVYMPNGDRLEAHSGLYDKLDDPRYVRVKMRGPTPPNVYDLTLREQLFHGVRAIRLNPVDDNKMFGRDGMLAHTYMLGPNGQSNGCVSFKNYDKFLEAFLRGEVDRLVVVPDGGTKLAFSGRRRGPVNRYADNAPVERNLNAW